MRNFVIGGALGAAAGNIGMLAILGELPPLTIIAAICLFIAGLAFSTAPQETTNA